MGLKWHGHNAWREQLLTSKNCLPCWTAAIVSQIGELSKNQMHFDCACTIRKTQKSPSVHLQQLEQNLGNAGHHVGNLEFAAPHSEESMAIVTNFSIDIFPNKPL